jgi:ribosomal protein S18 acetylase RimI-like enzyme
MEPILEQPPFRFLADCNESHREHVTEKLKEFNRVHMEALLETSEDVLPSAPVEIYVQTAEETIIAGLVGRTNSIRSWLEITVLWVAESYREQGLGRELMERAENEARRRGCRYARLATSDFQAPGFYQKLGYRLYGTLENCPPGVNNFYYVKDLAATKPLIALSE